MKRIPDSLETLEVESQNNVLTITLNRPDRLNAFNDRMIDELHGVWQAVRDDDQIYAVVLRASEGRAFCVGSDQKDRLTFPDNVWSRRDPGVAMGPKSNEVWKPVICAVHGMCAGGAFYLINESDIIIAAETATFFDPHVSWGMVSALEPAGLLRRIPIGEVMRWALMSLDERMSARRAHEIGLVSEVVAEERLWERAHEIAAKVAAKHPSAVQGTVKAIWEGSELSRRQAQMIGLNYSTIGNPISRDSFEPGRQAEWELR